MPASEAVAKILEVTSAGLERIDRSEGRLHQLMQVLAEVLQKGAVGNQAAPKAQLPAPAKFTLPSGEFDTDRYATSCVRRPIPRSFQSWEYVAPYDGLHFPSSLDFGLVECFDLSEDGVSFFLEEAPVAESFVIVLGNPPRRIYLQAEVIRVVGMIRYFIDCRLIRRLEPRPGFDLPTRSGHLNAAWVGDLRGIHAEIPRQMA
jgi:hypothetical protein